MATTALDRAQLPMVPVDRIKPIVDRWVSEHEFPEEAFQELAAASPITADTWRIRLSAATVVSRRTGNIGHRGWWSYEEIDTDDVDEFLTAAGLTHCWHSELADLVPEWKPSDEDFDATCALCRNTIDWDAGDLGVRIELKEPHRWTRWWSICGLCFARHYYRPHRKSRTNSPTTFKRRFTDATLLELYEVYARNTLGLDRIAEKVWREHGFASARSCSATLSHRWRQYGWPLRGRDVSRRLNGKGRIKRLSKISEDDLRKMHKLHWRRKLSLNAIAKQLYRKYGYKTHHSCAVAISNGFKVLGLPVHDRIEMTVEASTIHGRARRPVMADGTRNVNGSKAPGYKRWLMDQRAGHSTLQPTCIETVNSGRRCKRRSMMDSDYCEYHDPRRREKRLADLERMRARSPIHDPARLEPYGPFREELRAHFQAVGSWKPLAEASGIDAAYLSHLAGDKTRQRIAKTKAAALRAAIAQVMGDELELAA